jgi:hypothetical protein
MNRMSVLLAPPLFAVLALPAAAQTVPKEAWADGWCGALLTLVVGDMPAKPNAQELELAGIFLDASVTLMDRAGEAHRQAGFSYAQTNAFAERAGFPR